MGGRGVRGGGGRFWGAKNRRPRILLFMVFESAGLSHTPGRVNITSKTEFASEK